MKFFRLNAANYSSNVSRLFCLGMVFIAILSSCSLEDDSTIKHFRWNYNLTGPVYPVINSILIDEEYDSSSRTLAYYTGGQSGGMNELTTVPMRVEVLSIVNQVTVRSRVFDGFTRKDLKNEVNVIAKIIDKAVTEIWPSDVTPVIVDYIIVPNDAAYSFAKKVKWTNGQPYELVVFERDSRNFYPETPIHELYHVLSARWKIGGHDPKAKDRPKAYQTYEEVAGDLFAKCGKLLVDKKLTFDSSIKPTFSTVDRDIKGPLNDDDLKYALDYMAHDKSINTMIRLVLTPTALHNIFAEDKTITLKSKKADEMLELCRKVSANPVFLEEWFRHLIKK